MTGQQLKNSILQLAIQGRLVAQDPYDEPASVLLARIRREKEQLVKAGKLKKKDLISTPITEEEKPFDIPETWEWCRLSQISCFNGGYAFKSINYVEKGKGIRVLRISDFSESGISNTSAVYHPQDDKLNKFILENNDIVICMTGGTVGKLCHVKNLKEVFYVNQRVADIKILKSTESAYIYHVLTSTYIQNIINDSKNSTNDNISAQLINDFLIPLPPLSEQRRIVSKIEELMPLVEAYGKAQVELEALNAGLPEALKKSILQEAIQGRLVPQDANEEPASVLLARIRREKEQLVKAGKLKKKDLISTPITEDEKPFDIPETWEWCRLKDVFTMQAGKNIKADELSSERDSTHQYPCYGGNGIRGYIAKSSHNGAHCIVGRQGALCGNVNIASGTFYATEHAVVVETYASTDTNWAYYFLVASNLNQYATATAQPGLAVANILETLIPLPPLSEQRRIVSKIESLFAAIDKMKEQK